MFVLKLYEHFGDIEKAWNCSDLSFYEDLSVSKAKTFLKERDKTDVDKVVRMVTERNLK